MGRKLRDRRGRGRRGPDLLPGPLTPDGVPRASTPAERFDALALAVLADVEAHADAALPPLHLPPLELAVEEIPVLPADWSGHGSGGAWGHRVPLGSHVAPQGPDPARIVLFRRPLEHRAEGRADLAALLLAVLVEQIGELTGLAPADLHPDYPGDFDDD